MTLSLLAVGHTCRLIHGDSAAALQSIAPGSVDAVVTDPPSSIGFMGAEWDSDRGGRGRWVQWLRRIMKLALVALKPGGYALVWALPRRSHWTALAVEVAGFEIRDVHHHIFASGMPKSPAVLKPAVEHWIMGRKPFRGSLKECIAKHGTGGLNIEACRIATDEKIAPFGSPKKSSGGLMNGTEQPREQFEQHPGGRWPAHLSLDEIGAAALDEQSGASVSGARNEGVRQGIGYKAGASGDGAPEIKASTGGASRFFAVLKGDRCSSSVASDADLNSLPSEIDGDSVGSPAPDRSTEPSASMLNGGPVDCLDRSTSETRSESNPSAETNTPPIRTIGGRSRHASKRTSTSRRDHVKGAATQEPIDTTTITASRSMSGSSVEDAMSPSMSNSKDPGVADLRSAEFRYIAKPSDAERTAHAQVNNDHETVKSIALMSWLVRLIAPPGGLVLDPFAGSGTTGLACAAEGMSFIGVEQSPKHHATASKRLQLAYGSVLP